MILFNTWITGNSLHPSKESLPHRKQGLDEKWGHILAVQNVFNKHKTLFSVRVLKGKEEKDTQQDIIRKGNKKISREEIKYFYGAQVIQQITWRSDLLL